MTLPWWWKMRPRHYQPFTNMFAVLELIAGLALNRPKCVLIPLWPSSLEQARQEIATSFAEWAQIAVEYSGTYLVEPGSVDKFWDKAVKK